MRYLIVTDIHEDLKMLKRAFSKAAKHGFDKAICLGDISGYSVPYYKYLSERDARGCLHLLQDREAIILPGNHDYYAAQRIPVTSGVISVPANWYELDYSSQKEIASGNLWLSKENELDPLYSAEDVGFLNSLDEYLVLNEGAHKILLSHYFSPNMAGFSKDFYYSVEDFRTHFEFMKGLNCSISIAGHAHARGSYNVTGSRFRMRGYGSHKVQDLPVCYGLPPVTRHNKRSGFSIFDTENLQIRISRI